MFLADTSLNGSAVAWAKKQVRTIYIYIYIHIHRYTDIHTCTHIRIGYDADILLVSYVSIPSAQIDR